MAPARKPPRATPPKETVRKGKAEVFGLGILNTLNSGPNFVVGVKEGPLIKTDGGEEAAGTYTSLAFIDERTTRIDNNEFAIVSLPVSVPRDVIPGTYVLNVYICNGTVSDGVCDGLLSGNPTNKNKDELYDGFVHKIYVTVK